MDLERAVVDLLGRMAKGRAEDVLPLHGQLHAVLIDMYEDQGCPGPARNAFPTMPGDRTRKSDLRRAGLAFADEGGKHLYSHSLRTTFTAMLLRLGNTASQAKRATRHRSAKVLEEDYSHLNVDDTREMIPGLPTFAPPSVTHTVSIEPISFVAQGEARYAHHDTSHSFTLQMKATAGRIAAGLIEELSLFCNGSHEGEWLQDAPYVLDDFRRSFDDLESWAISLAG